MSIEKSYLHLSSRIYTPGIMAENSLLINKIPSHLKNYLLEKDFAH